MSKFIPIRYQNAKIEDVSPNIKDLLNDKKEKNGIFIHGDIGTGKTHILWAIVSKLEEENKEHHKKVGLNIDKIDWWVINTTDMLRNIKREFDHKSEDDLLNRVINFNGYLFLDDVGSEKLSEWTQETFYLILNKRYENILPTIITSNFSIDKLGERIGDRTASRIVGLCHIAKLNGTDRRIGIGQQ